MKNYALYSNNEFVVAKPFYTEPTTPYDFGVGAIPTSEYTIIEIIGFDFVYGFKTIPATIDVR